MKELIEYLQHLPTCTMKQDWGEAVDAMLDTPTNFRDEGWTEAMEEMNRKMKTCSCGLEDVKNSLQPKGKTKEEVRKNFCLWYYAESQPLDANKVFDWFCNNMPEYAQSHANKDGCPERFKRPTDDEVVSAAILFNEGKLEPEKLSDMVALADFIIDRLYENGDMSIPTLKENADSNEPQI